MTMTKQPEPLPRPAAELERLAEYYDTHDTSAEMEAGEWAEPQPIATTSLRLPVEVSTSSNSRLGNGICATPATCGQSWSALPVGARRRR
jgi:hypothetical protein